MNPPSDLEDLPGPADVPPVATGAALPTLLETGDPPKHVIIPRWMVLVGLIVLQIVMSRAMMTAPVLGLAQALAMIGLIAYGTLRREAATVMCVLVYVPWAEIVWRQVQAPVPYMVAPYTIVLAGVLLILTQYKQLTKPGRVAIFYFLLLVPSAVVTIAVVGATARELIAFQFSGPVAMAVLVVLFSQITLEAGLYRRLLWVMLVSSVGPIAIALTTINQYLATEGSIDFTSESNYVTSGGFGPVQVSSMMGLGVLIAVLAFLVERDPMVKLIAVALGLFGIIFAFLTFSRGGMTATAIALAIFALSQARDPQVRLRIFTVVVLVFLVGYFILVPRLNDATEGAFDTRFSSSSTPRTRLAENDMEIFRQHLPFGVGAGMTKYNRIPYELCQLRSDKCSEEASSHTEFTRMLGEHGLPGLLAIALVIQLIYLGWVRAGPTRPVTAMMLSWAVAQMFYANFRVVGIAFAFAFAFVHIDDPLGKEARARRASVRTVRSDRRDVGVFEELPVASDEAGDLAVGTELGGSPSVGGPGQASPQFRI